MHPLLFTLFLAVSTCLGHYRWDYESRNRIERDEPIKMDGYDLVECPVCLSNGDWRYREESCEVIENKRYKKCYYGVYKNRACGYRYDCFRGADEDCMINEDHDIRCKPGSHCTELKKCSGGGEGSIDQDQMEGSRNFHMLVAPGRWPKRIL